MKFPASPEDWFPVLVEDALELGVLLDALGAVEREAKRRRAGHQPDRRFDLALAVLGDLAELIYGVA